MATLTLAHSTVTNLGEAPVIAHATMPTYEKLFKMDHTANSCAPWSPRDPAYYRNGVPQTVPEYTSRLARVHRVASANLHIQAAKQARDDAWRRHTANANQQFHQQAARSFSARRTRERAVSPAAWPSSPRSTTPRTSTPRERVVELQQKIDDAKGRLDATLMRLAATEKKIVGSHGHVAWPGAGLR